MPMSCLSLRNELASLQVVPGVYQRPARPRKSPEGIRNTLRLLDEDSFPIGDVVLKQSVDGEKNWAAPESTEAALRG